MTRAAPALQASDATLPVQALRVGEWLVAGDLNRITRGDEAVVVEPKVMALLLWLAGRPGEVVGREELLAAVWPGVVVGDNALTQGIAKLRKALGDTAQQPAYIEAIAKKGYRLIAPVQPPGVAAPRPTGGRRERRRLPAAAALAAAALAAALVWVVVTGARPPAAAAGSTGTAPDGSGLPVVVVQPFASNSDAAAEATLARAITADLVTDLSKVAGLRVVSAAEAPGALQGAAAPATYRLSGTVQQDGQRMRLNVLLSRAASGEAVWSTRLDRRARDLFAVQDDLTHSILQMLPVKLSAAETRRLANRQTRNVEAWQTFVRAQFAMLVRQRAANQEARGLFWDAIRQDPAFARAYSGVAMTHALDYQMGWSDNPAAALARAAELAQTSINMNPELPESRWVMAFVRTQRREHEAALKDLDEALRLNPSYADAHALKGGIETYVGHPAQALPSLRQALRLHPDGGSLVYLLLGRAYFFLGDAEQAQVNLGEALARNAQSVEAHLYLAAAQVLAGDLGGARWQADEVHALDPAFSVRAWLDSYPLTDAAQRARLQATLETVGLR